MKERDEAFFAVVDGFDEWMSQHGYYTVEEAAARTGMSYHCLYHRIIRDT